MAALLARTAARGAGAVIGFLDFATWLGHDELLETNGVKCESRQLVVPPAGKW
jgi:hypothetical protein